MQFENQSNEISVISLSACNFVAKQNPAENERNETKNSNNDRNKCMYMQTKL